MAEKKLQLPEKIAASLLALRDEYATGLLGKSGDVATIFMKINSCLYSEYPVTFQPKGDDNAETV